MNAQPELIGLLEQWLRLTQEESVAIHAASWKTLKEIQARKADIQTRFFQANASRHADDASNPEPLRALGGRLISLLARNAEALAAQVRAARAKQSHLEGSKRTLAQIHRSYVRPDAMTAWQSYS